MVEKTFRKAIEDYGLLKKRDSILLGVSAGPDSIFMLHQFLELRQEYKLNLVGVHFNHSLRKEADGEEDFIKQLCKSLKVRCISEKKDVKKFFKGNSLEQTARELRFDFFLKCSRQTKIKKISLAHHKDDLIETVLIRLIRGAGLRGLRGFLPKSKFKSLTVVRPLIQIRKKEIIDWLKRKKISYCIDKSNFEEKFFRNRIRLKLLPFLEEFNPNIADSLFNSSCTVAVDYEFMHAFSHEKFQALKTGIRYNGIQLNGEGLKKLPAAIFNNVIRIAVEELKGNVRSIEARHLDEIRDLVFNRPEASIVDLPSLIVKKEGKVISIQTLIL